jgi:uncharacterized protein (TIGR04255 family)
MPKEYKAVNFNHYENAPIVEAVLEASITRSNPVAMDELEEIVGDSNKYPKRVELMTASGQMTVGPTVSASATSQRIGYQFVSDDRKLVVHCKVDGLSISRLAPYTTWKDVFAEFAAHWARYVDKITPSYVTQLAVRYINRFDFPGGRVELHDYFRTYPEVSEDIKFDISGFLNQIHIPMPDIGGQAIITQARVPPPSPQIISVLLDIAVSKAINESPENFEIKSEMDVLRARKNQLFEACIKPQARDLIRETPN